MNVLKTLAGEIKEYKKESIITPLFMILEVIMEMIIPLMMSSIIDNGIEKGDVGHIVRIGLFMILAAAIGLFAGVMGGVFGAKASAGFAKNLRKAMFNNIQTFSFSNIDRFSSASLVTRMTTDVTNIQHSYNMILRMCFRSPITLVIAMIMSFSVNAKLASIYLVAVLILGCILALIIKFAMKYFKQLFKRYDGVNANVQENVSAARVVKAYVREAYEKSKFGKSSDELYRMGVKAERIVVVNMPFMMATVYTCILLISWFGAKMIVHNTLTTGELMMLLAYCMNILISLMLLSMIFVMVSMSVASAERISEVINEKADITNPENPVHEVADGSISFKDVTFRYNEKSEKPILNHINIDIKSGETIGILGGTGSAKSSLVNLISRLYDTSEGEVFVGGKNVKEYDLETLRKQVAVVLQKSILFSGTILENLRWGDKNATEEECMRACKLADADGFIRKMPDGYHTKITQGGTNVSGGQKQRLCIARALLCKPKILILDDSTSAVDTATDAKIRAAFANEIPDTTKIIIAQRVSSIQDADRIIVMEHGEVNAFGTHEELLANNEIYRDVYEAQTQEGGDFDENGGEA